MWLVVVGQRAHSCTLQSKMTHDWLTERSACCNPDLKQEGQKEQISEDE
jgi:hypothetical protein